MELIEIRDLDGPNIFILEPAIKVEFSFDPDDWTPQFDSELIRRLDRVTLINGDLPLGERFQRAICAIHERLSLPCPRTAWTELETPGHFALAFGWWHRRFALGAAQLLASVALGEAIDLVAVTARPPREVCLRTISLLGF